MININDDGIILISELNMGPFGLSVDGFYTRLRHALYDFDG